MVVNVGLVFGKLNAQTVGDLDEDVLITIASMTKDIAKVPIPKRTYDNISLLFSQRPLVQALGDDISRADSLIKEDDAALNTNGSLIVQDVSIRKRFPSYAQQKLTILRVAAWFRRFVGGDDISEGASIDINVLGLDVAQTSAAKDFSAFFLSEEHARKSLDVVGIRYPEPGRPYFSVSCSYQMTIYSYLQ